jgi:hypothetical protein
MPITTKRSELEPYVVKFVSDLRLIGGFLRVLHKITCLQQRPFSIEVQRLYR